MKTKMSASPRHVMAVPRARANHVQPAQGREFRGESRVHARWRSTEGKRKDAGQLRENPADDGRDKTGTDMDSYRPCSLSDIEYTEGNPSEIRINCLLREFWERIQNFSKDSKVNCEDGGFAAVVKSLCAHWDPRGKQKSAKQQADTLKPAAQWTLWHFIILNGFMFFFKKKIRKGRKHLSRLRCMFSSALHLI